MQSAYSSAPAEWVNKKERKKEKEKKKENEKVHIILYIDRMNSARENVKILTAIREKYKCNLVDDKPYKYLEMN